MRILHAYIFKPLKLFVMSHEEFLKTLVTEELLAEYDADLLVCELIEGEDEEDEE